MTTDASSAQETLNNMLTKMQQPLNDQDVWSFNIVEYLTSGLDNLSKDTADVKFAEIGVFMQGMSGVYGHKVKALYSACLSVLGRGEVTEVGDGEGRRRLRTMEWVIDGVLGPLEGDRSASARTIQGDAVDHVTRPKRPSCFVPPPDIPDAVPYLMCGKADENFVVMLVTDDHVKWISEDPALQPPPTRSWATYDERMKQAWLNPNVQGLPPPPSDDFDGVPPPLGDDDDEFAHRTRGPPSDDDDYDEEELEMKPLTENTHTVGVRALRVAQREYVPRLFQKKKVIGGGTLYNETIFGPMLRWWTERERRKLASGINGTAKGDGDFDDDFDLPPLDDNWDTLGNEVAPISGPKPLSYQELCTHLVEELTKAGQARVVLPRQARALGRWEQQILLLLDRLNLRPPFNFASVRVWIKVQLKRAGGRSTFRKLTRESVSYDVPRIFLCTLVMTNFGEVQLTDVEPDDFTIIFLKDVEIVENGEVL
jgi:hypothetical protein